MLERVIAKDRNFNRAFRSILDHAPSVNTIFAVEYPRKSEFRSSSTQICNDIPPNFPNSDSDAQPFPKRGENFISPSDTLIKLDFRCRLG